MMTDLMRLEHFFCRHRPRADVPRASVGFAMQALNLAPIWAEEQGIQSDLAVSEAGLNVYQKLHKSPEGQQHNALFTTIEAFGALLLELDVELSPVKIIQTLDQEAQWPQRIDFELLVPVPSEWIEFERLRSVLAAARPLSPRDRAAKRSRVLGRAADPLLGK